MSYREYSLLAVYPFDAVEQQLLKLREKIFTLTGFASALALPPLIPLCYLPGNLNANAVREVLIAGRIDIPFVLSATGEKQRIIHLQTHNEQQLAQKIAVLTERILATKRRAGTPNTASPALFPIPPGFFLAVNQEQQDISALCSLWNPGQELLFTAYQLILLRMQVYSPLETWWQNLEWEITLCVKNKTKAVPIDA